MNFKRLICAISLAVIAVCFTVERKPEMSRDVEVGMVFEQNIPILFTNFQHTSMAQFKRTNGSGVAGKMLCRVRVAEEGALVQRSAVAYGLGGFKNASEQYYLDRIIYTLKDLQFLRAFVDAIFFEGSIVALFSGNQVIVYEVGLKEGSVSQKRRFQLSQQFDLANAQFVAINRTLLLVSSKLAVAVGLDGTVGGVSEFGEGREELTMVKQVKGEVFVGLGEQGLAKYSFSGSTGQLSLEYSTLVRYKSNSGEVQFDVDQFQVDPVTRQLYVLDYSQGILQVDLYQIKLNNTTTSSKAIKLVSGCRNLVLLSSRIFVTCPQITQIQRSTGRIVRIIRNSFSPYSLQFHDQRLYLYGRKEFAVYDLYGKTLAEYTLNIHSQLSLVVSGFLITFGSFGMVSQYIIAQQQELYCFSSDPEDVGHYSGVMQTEGVCKEYYGSSLPSVRPDEMCFIEYPFRMEIKDTYKLDLTVQIILVVVWLGLSAIFGLVMAVKNYCVHRTYGELNEQEYKELQQISNNPSVQQKQKKKKSDEVVVTD